MQGYNCDQSSDSSYGASAYSTCTTSTVGTPNTGFFQTFFASGSFEIILPLAASIILVVVASIVVRRRKKRA